MLEAINYIRNVSKKIATIDKIVIHLIYLNNGGASNWDKESKKYLKEMQTKGIINASCESFIPLSLDFSNFSIIQDDICIKPQVNYDVISATANPVIPTHISDLAIATLKLCDKIMAMKSFFMDEPQTINNELLTSPKNKTL